MTAEERAARTQVADDLCIGAYDAVAGPEVGVALVAVGGFGRGDMAPGSDLDVVLVHHDEVELGEWAQQLWYPLWDSGVKLDHSIRSLSEMTEVAGADLKVALGLLDIRHLAGDPNVTLRLRTATLAAWRHHARERLPQLQQMVTKRHRTVGELAHLSVPDIKEAEGGLRDAVVLKGLGATWLVDVPVADLERCRLQLLDVRDLLHEAAGRGTDRINPELWGELAAGLDLADDLAVQRHVRELGRRISHLSKLTWRRVDDALRRSPASRPRRPQLAPVAPGVALSRGEIVLDAKAKPGADPLLLLRAAAEAAERDVVLAPPTAARLVRECAPLPDPWPDAARQLMVRLLAAGPGLLAVWETLEETGALPAILPEWERIRLLPHASEIHRFTVDRHVIETCVEAASLIREVSRPDVLVVAALLHDIGKGGLTEHSQAGEPVAREVAGRMGFADHEVDLIGLLVRWHLLLSQTATTRDLEDPATIATVTDRIDSAEALALLTALTEADAKATSPKAWTSWRAGLIHDLARRAQASLAQGAVPDALLTDEVEIPGEVLGGGTSFRIEPVLDGAQVTVVARDRIGLLADVAATFALQKIPIRAARVWPQGEYGVSVWDVAEQHLTPGMLRDRYEGIVGGRIDPAARLAPPAESGKLAPTVVVRPEASDHATVLEVRAADRVGVVHQVSATLARLDMAVRSAHVSTLGPQAVDVFYVQEAFAGALSDDRAADAAHAVRATLAG